MLILNCKKKSGQQHYFGVSCYNKDTLSLSRQKGNSLQLSKGDVTYAIIQKMIMDRIYKYTKSTATEQMLIAAYFVVIELNW